MKLFGSRRSLTKLLGGVLLLSCVAGCSSLGNMGADPNGQLVRAAKAGNVPAIEDAVAAGADVNVLDYSEKRNGLRPLGYAAVYNRPDAIRALVALGAGINLANGTGFTALHHAAEAGSAEAAKALVDLGADRSLRHGGGQTPAQVAEESGHPEVAAILR